MSFSTYFKFDGKLYKQIKGLAMGNRLTQVLAEIFTNFALLKVVQMFDASMISFIYEFVDDVFAAMPYELLTNFNEMMMRE